MTFSIETKHGRIDVRVDYEDIKVKDGRQTSSFSKVYKRYTIIALHDLSVIYKDTNCIDPSVFFTEEQVRAMIRKHFAHMRNITRNI